MATTTRLETLTLMDIERCPNPIVLMHYIYVRISTSDGLYMKDYRVGRITTRKLTPIGRSLAAEFVNKACEYYNAIHSDKVQPEEVVQILTQWSNEEQKELLRVEMIGQ